MSIIYIDTESNNNQQIIEIAAIKVKDKVIKQVNHHFIKQTNTDSFSYRRTAENSHCIPFYILKQKGIEWIDYTTDFYLMFNDEENVTIKTFGYDLTKENLQGMFPFLMYLNNVDYEQVYLPGWIERQKEPYHISAFNMKLQSKIIGCSDKYHCMEYNPYWKRIGKKPSHSEIAKYAYTYHCALVDAYELAFKDGAIPNYCCDTHFENCFYTKPINYQVCTCNSPNCKHDVVDN